MLSKDRDTNLTVFGSNPTPGEQVNITPMIWSAGPVDIYNIF
jgi:hypothetical protein